MNFKQSSIDFVRENNCANYVPADLIQKAMEFGAMEAIKLTTEKIKIARVEMENFRNGNNAPR